MIFYYSPNSSAPTFLIDIELSHGESYFHIHGFSLIPDSKSASNGGRERSILLAHRKNGVVHLNKFVENGFDSILFTAEDFAEDLEKLLDLIFAQLAHEDASVGNNIIEWVNKYLPVMALNNN